MKQHRVVGLKNVVIDLAAQTAGFFYSTVRCLVTSCVIVRAPIQIHHSFTIPIRSRSYLYSHPIFQINFSRSEKGGTQHSIVI